MVAVLTPVSSWIVRYGVPSTGAQVTEEGGGLITIAKFEDRVHERGSLFRPPVLVLL